MRDIAQTIKERQQAFEAHYKMDEELNFRIRSRRDRYFGLWAAHELGFGAIETEKYASTIMRLDLDVAGDDNMLEQVMCDLKDGGVMISREGLMEALRKAEREAQMSVMREHPHALDRDHHA